MEGFDIREPWQEGRIPFMSDDEYEFICQGRKRDQVSLLILKSCDIADAAINKMMRVLK